MGKKIYMSKINLSFVFLILLGIHDSVFSADEKVQFEWEEGHCFCKANTISSLVSVDTAKLFLTQFMELREIKTLGWSILHKYSSDDLIEERDRYISRNRSRIESYKNTDIPDVIEFKNYIDDLIYEAKLEEFLYTSELNYLATGDSSYLKRDFEGNSHMTECGSHAQNLSNDQSIYNSLSVQIESNCSKNIYPEICRNRALDRAIDINGARIEVLTFGWHNCVNSYYRNIRPPRYNEAYQTMKRFIENIQCECDT